jgi:NO-binding membrane sensor protein with MHYT domain
MNEQASSIDESSLLLWLLAAMVALLAAHVGLAWVREGQRQPRLQQRWPALAIAAATLGTGLCATMVLGLSAEALGFQIGYRTAAAPVLWLLAMAGSLPVAAWLMHDQRTPAKIGAGVVLGALAAAVQAGWIAAAGFQPGINWPVGYVASAAGAMAVAATVALGLAFSDASKEGRYRQYWRVGAAVLLGLGVLAGQEILIYGVDLSAQVGSASRRELSATVLCLACGALVPLVLAVMALHIEMRRRPMRRRGQSTRTTSQPARRRKRRHPVRTL